MKKTIVTLLVCVLLSTVAHSQSSGSLQPPGSGNAIRFDGVDDKLAVAGNSTIGGTFTVELWAKPDDVAGPRGSSDRDTARTNTALIFTCIRAM